MHGATTFRIAPAAITVDERTAMNDKLAVLSEVGRCLARVPGSLVVSLSDYRDWRPPRTQGERGSLTPESVENRRAQSRSVRWKNP